MEGLHDLLDSRLMYLDDQLEMVVMGWCYYHQYGDELPTYLYYDVYNAIGIALEGTYSGYPEYSTDMARDEARKAVDSVVAKMVTAMDEIKDQLEVVVLPLLKADNDDCVDVVIGGVTLVGGDMAVRVDYVRQEYDTAVMGGDSTQ